MYNHKVDTYLNIIFTISTISLIAAYFIEYILGHQPCNLCLIERILWIKYNLIALNYI